MTSTAGVAPANPHDSGSKAPRGRKLTGYWLILPGAVWLGLFFVIPFYSLVASSLFDPNGSVLTGYDMTGTSTTSVDAIDQYKGDLGRSLLYAGIATILCLVIGYVLAYAIAFKAGSVEEPHAGAGHRAVLHELPAPHAVVEADPGRRRLGRRASRRRCISSNSCSWSDLTAWR